MAANGIRISVEQMQAVLFKVFRNYGFSTSKAQLLSEVHTESTLVGVNSHGINRVAQFIEYVKKGLIVIDAVAEKAEGFGNLERWDGKFGAGVINATTCTNRAIELAKQQGMGLVALRNTNHWMRGGTYGYQAADDGCIAILFTNTQANMPPWGGRDSRIGNNPFIVAIPRAGGHVVLDMAISQFSFGKINNYRLKGEQLPYFGGWDDKDQLSKDPEKILQKERGLPIGYWKGSALSMILDMLATLLSAGNSTYRISQKPLETGISQVFLCIDPTIFGDQNLQQQLLNEIIAYTHDVPAMQPGMSTYFPGERSAQKRINNLEEGMLVHGAIWEKILQLSK